MEQCLQDMPVKAPVEAKMMEVSSESSDSESSDSEDEVVTLSMFININNNLIWFIKSMEVSSKSSDSESSDSEHA